MPRAWIVWRRVWVGVFTFAIGMVVLLPLMQGLSVQNHRVGCVRSWIVLSMAFMLFLMPHNNRDVIVCSQPELRAWQIKSLTGSLLVGLSSLVCTLYGVYTLSDWGVMLFCGITIICLLVSPWFFRLCAWRIWVGMVLVVVLRMV